MRHIRTTCTSNITRPVRTMDSGRIVRPSQTVRHCDEVRPGSTEQLTRQPTRRGFRSLLDRVNRQAQRRRLASTGTVAVVVVGTLTASLAVAAPTAGAVVGGFPSGPAPWAVQITTFHNLPGTPCTGVVIDPFWVATAGHCGPADPLAYTLGFGTHGTLPGGLAQTASAATPTSVGGLGSLDTGSLGRHTPIAAYHAPGGDFLLLKLRHPAPSPSVLRAGADPAPGAVLRFHGFGSVAPGPTAPRSAELRTGLTRLERMEPRGGTWIGRNHTIEGGFAFGDSGGPVFSGDRLVGIHSGSDHARRQLNGTNPAWYESIPTQNGWIDWMIAHR